MSRHSNKNVKNTSYMKIELLAALLTVSISVQAQNLIPQPVSVERGSGVYDYSLSTTVVCTDPSLTAYLQTYFSVSKVAGINSSIFVAIDPTLDLPAEGYELVVEQGRIRLRGKNYGGAFNGVQTLLQLFPPEVYKGNFHNPCTIGELRVRDYPRFGYRGMLLDVARTFSTVDEIKRYIDRLAHCKINRLHLHLTDNEAWRVEIDGHPALTAVGAFRGGDSPIRAVYGKWNERYGGYYTADDLRGLVRYAAARNMEIIPEIDLPGHSRAAGKVYPEILCDVPFDTVSTGGYDRRNVWCVAREANYTLLDDIIRSISSMFPSRYIHIGGDEVDMSCWQSCKECKALCDSLGYTDSRQLEGYFMNRLIAILRKYGKQPAVWNEASDGGNLSKDAVIYGWENVEACRKVTEEGYRTVVMPGQYCYFDMRQSPFEPGHKWAGVFDVSRTYSLNLDSLGFSAAQKANVVGFEGAFWSETYLTNRDKYRDYLSYQTFPRICALAELAWSPEGSCSWPDFERRLREGEYARMTAMGTDFRADAPKPADEKRLTPEMTFTSSMTFRKAGAEQSVSKYADEFGFGTSTTCRNGDWLLYTFAEPLKCSRIEITTGYRHISRALFPSGYVEVSADGTRFRRVAELSDGAAIIVPRHKVKAVRVVCTADSNGDAFVQVQYPVIFE